MSVFGLVKSEKQLPDDFYRTKALPIGFLMALSFYLSNVVYLYLTVSFISMLKALQPAVTMLALFVARLETPSRRLILSVCLIAVGTGLTSAGEVNFNLLGVAMMLGSLCTDSSRLVMTQVLLQGFKFHPVEGLKYLAPSCTAWLFLGSALFELRAMLAKGAFGFILANPGPFLATAILGFFVNWLNYYVIKNASALTLKVLGPIKNAIVVLSGIMLLQEVVTPLQFFGYAVSVAAFFWYNMIKLQQAAVSKPPTLPAYTSPTMERTVLSPSRGGVVVAAKHLLSPQRLARGPSNS
ncbi:hypothetical protein N2152v2_010547 [Parachlorella kessleri]